jgi:hypothetical protein
MPQSIGEWKSRCKICGSEIGYSDWSYQKMLGLGYSRPEYCKEHQEQHKRQKSGMGIAYFDLKPYSGTDLNNIQPGWLGKLSHPERPHTLEQKQIKFKLGTNYGLTPDDLKMIFSWFGDPQHQVLLVVGETGSGKSTALPICLMFPPEGFKQDQFTQNGQILITQPRIIATQGIAKHLGNELLNSTTGENYDIGYRHSKDRNAGWRNRGYFMTDGSLLNILERGELGNVSLIMIDEAHELSENIEAILRTLKKQLPLYPHLKLIIASATINEDLFLKAFSHLGVKKFHLNARDADKFGYGEPHFAAEDDALPFDLQNNTQNQVQNKPQSKAKSAIVEAATAKTIWLLEEIVRGKTPGDILVFVPGEKQIEGVISRVNSAIKDKQFKRKRINTFRVISTMSQGEMERLREANTDPTYIRVFVGTNVAETSVTIEGLVYVIDSGIENQEQWNSKLNQKMIVPVAISKANAKQRWGRCGRTRKGEVFCLYTKDQFKNFIEFPIPDLKRLPTDNVILTAKAVGLREDEIRDGWVNTPPKEEIERATKVLTEKGALNQSGFISDYGMLLRHFSYPAQLADLIMLADRFGVVIEMATLIPILKNGGKRKILKWRHNWDAYTKREVAKIHKGLQSGCIDDIEFCLKIYSLWKDPYGNEGESSVSDRQKAWAKAFFVNEDEMKEIDAESNEILNQLYGHRKNQNLREIDLTLVDKVRLVIAYAMPEVLQSVVPPQLGSYFFEAKATATEGSSMTAKVFLPSDWREKLIQIRTAKNSMLSFARWVGYLTKQSRESDRNKSFISRLFIDQAFPIDASYRCRLDILANGGIEPVSFVSFREPISEKYREDVDEYELSDKDDTSEAYEIVLQIHGLRSSYFLKNALPSQLPEIVARVSGYRFSKLAHPIVEFETVPSIEPFHALTTKYRASEIVEVEVIGHEVYPEDYKKALLVREITTGMEILMGPEDLAFTSSSSLVEIYPIHAQFRTYIRQIDRLHKRVKLTILPFIEGFLKAIVERLGTDDKGQIEIGATVMDVILFDEEEEKNDRVLLNLEWSRPDLGIIFTVSGLGKALPKRANEFQVDEKYRVRLQLATDWDFKTGLSDLPKSISYLMDDADSSLSWKTGVLIHQGAMSYKELNRYKALDKSESYQRALERLYHLSNQLAVRKVIDTVWADQTLSAYPVGSTLQNIVVTIVENGGYSFNIASNVIAFAPRSKTYRDYNVGDVIPTARVIEINTEYRNLVLDLKTLENSPLSKYREGMYVQGIVVEAEQKWIKLELGPGIRARLHVKDTPQYIPDARRAFTLGQKVMARIIKINLDRNQIDLSTKPN